jgi:hypothetical protein
VQHTESGRLPLSARGAATRQSAPSDIHEDQYQVIAGWSVVGNDRIVGNLHSPAATATGKRIMTSPVVKIRFLGNPRTPVAFTESGSAYWLGPPSSNFDPNRAMTFVWTKSRDRHEPAHIAEPGSQTTFLRLVD